MTEKDGVRLAQIGLGRWSSVIANGVVKSSKAELVTCYTRTPEKRKVFSEKYGCDQEESYEDVLRRDDVDGVLLTSPNAVHAEQAELAAKYGKHVFVDKPIANTIAHGKRIVEACEKAGVVLLVGHSMRRFAGFRKLKELVDAGAMGDFIQVDAVVSHNGGFSKKPEDFRWRGDDSGCPAGSLMTLGIHHADILNHLFGPIETVFSFFAHRHIPAPNDDVTATIFKFESGALGYLGSNYASPRVNWMYIYGTEANLLCTVNQPTLSLDESFHRVPTADQNTRVQIFEKGKAEPRDVPINTGGDPICEEITEFAECIQTGKRPETDGKAALVALALIRAAIDSARTGEPAKIEIRAGKGS